MMKRYSCLTYGPFHQLTLGQIFRRMVVHQRRKAQSVELAMHDREFGSDFDTDFWEDELDDPDPGGPSHGSLYYDLGSPSIHMRLQQAQDADADADAIMYSSPFRQPLTPAPMQRYHDSRSTYESDEDRWAREAAEAEQVERDMEEMDIARQVEEAYQAATRSPPAAGMDID